MARASNSAGAGAYRPPPGYSALRHTAARHVHARSLSWMISSVDIEYGHSSAVALLATAYPLQHRVAEMEQRQKAFDRVRPIAPGFAAGGPAGIGTGGQSR